VDLHRINAYSKLNNKHGVNVLTEKRNVSCLNWGATNNYPLSSIGKKVVCGRCKNSLPKPGEVLELSSDQASKFIRNSRLPILVDFFSPTCAPCQIMHIVVENLAKRRSGEVMTMRINVDQNPQLATQFMVQAVPTFIIFYRGNERDRTSGAMSEEDFAFWVASRT